MAKNDFIKRKNNNVKTVKTSQDKPKWSFWVVLALMVFWTVASVFGVLSFAGVKADSVINSYTYQGSNIIIPTTPRYFDGSGLQSYDSTKHYNYALFDFKINLTRANTQAIPPESELNKYQISYAFNSYFTSQYSEYDEDVMPLGQSYYKQSNLFVYDSLSPIPERTGAGSHYLYYFMVRKPVWVSNYKTVNLDNYLLTPQLLMYMYCSSPNFTANIVKVVLDSYVISTTDYNSLYPSQPIYTDSIYNNNIAFNTLTYYDNTGNYLQFEFPSPTTAILGDPDIPNSIIKNGFVLLQNRVYYTDNYLGSDVAYNDGKQAGIIQGIEEGKQSALEEWEQERETIRESAYNNGYSNGLSAGRADANEYSFLGLMSSVIDAPLNAFRQMFNFELFGVNMSSFYLSLFTVCIIIIILRLIF